VGRHPFPFRTRPVKPTYADGTWGEAPWESREILARFTGTMSGGVSTCETFLLFVPTESLLIRRRQSTRFKHVDRRGRERLTSRSSRLPWFRNLVLLNVKKAESSSLKFKFTQNSGSGKEASVWFDGNIGFCPICQGSGKVRCFDCNGYGIHPWAVVDERLAGGQPCKLCKGARVVSCPVCAPQSYKSLRASVLGISPTKLEKEQQGEIVQEEQDDSWVLQPTNS